MKRNRYTFGIGTIGRDMVYALISMYAMFYLTDVLELSTASLWWITGFILFAKIFDALNDPVMGVVVDNTRSRFGKFKPWIVIGGILSGIITILLFVDFGLEESKFVVLFCILYLFWGITYTINDISYWSVLPSLSIDQKERERIGAFARICANIGLFFVVAGIIPITTAFGDMFGSLQRGYLVFALLIVTIMWLGLAVTIFGVKETKMVKQQEGTNLKELVTIIFKNDQLLYVAVSLSLFMIGYMTTTSFGIYFFKYAYGDEAMYSIFALILGVSQLIALIVFPIISKNLVRSQFYLMATILVVIGYLVFLISPNTSMLWIGVAGVLLFVGQAFIQLLMLMFLADAVDYGHHKLGKRNDSITFSLQPFINKVGGAIASGVLGVTIIVSGIKDATSSSDVSTSGLWMMKFSMLVIPLLCILIGYIVYRKKYKIDEQMYNTIIEDLKARGEIDV